MSRTNIIIVILAMVVGAFLGGISRDFAMAAPTKVENRAAKERHARAKAIQAQIDQVMDPAVIDAIQGASLSLKQYLTDQQAMLKVVFESEYGM